MKAHHHSTYKLCLAWPIVSLRWVIPRLIRRCRCSLSKLVCMSALFSSMQSLFSSSNSLPFLHFFRNNIIHNVLFCVYEFSIVCLLYSCMCDNCSVISNWLWWPRVADYVATKQGVCILPFFGKALIFRNVALKSMVNNN